MINCKESGPTKYSLLYVCFAESRLEGWLSVPNKQNIRRHGWKKQYVVVSSKKIIFYNSESDKQNTDPVLILDLK
jgi:Rho-associated protein kinase 2